jgi:hypothetical protein
MAAIRQADTFNLKILRGMFPDIFEEFRQRYNAPGGILSEEQNINEERVEDEKKDLQH